MGHLSQHPQEINTRIPWSLSVRLGWTGEFCWPAQVTFSVNWIRRYSCNNHELAKILLIANCHWAGMQENDSKTNPNNPNIRREVDMKQKGFIANILIFSPTTTKSAAWDTACPEFAEQ